jgi:hypothetical protein
MRFPIFRIFVLVSTFLAFSASATIHYVDAHSINPIPPYTNWATAAINIQNAIDAASVGDEVLVTNGLYNAGGKVMAGDLTNRVAVDKAVTLRSVNGPKVTVIEGAGATNGTAAVRCAWLTNGAVLEGFTILHGATRLVSGVDLGAGGGVWCASSSASVANCLILSNNASFGDGGGIYQGTIRNSYLRGNTSSGKGSAAVDSNLINCTVVSNGLAGTYSCNVTNCIVEHFDGGYYSYSCGTYMSGPDSFSSDPQLLNDGMHLSNSSPCRGTGTSVATGTDIDGEPWGNRPSMGCDEWQPGPLVAGSPAFLLTNSIRTFRISASANVAGQQPLSYRWIRNGQFINDDEHFSSTHTNIVSITDINPVDAGTWQLQVSNAFGTAVSSISQPPIHYVDAAATNSTPPYSTWQTAATNIQSAVNAASAGEVVLVNDGLYNNGGKATLGLTNRVTIDKPLIVQSLNGAISTLIAGVGATNGVAAVRCAWMTNGTLLYGFTLQQGATRATGLLDAEIGGGVFCSSASALVANCMIVSNTAAAQGGGVYQGTLHNCVVFGNTAAQGGGCFNASLLNCTVVSNSGFAAYGCLLTNCIVYFNSSSLDYALGTLAYCCTRALPSGPGNFTNQPALVNVTAGDLHLQTGSPCINAGRNSYFPSSTDLDGSPRIAAATVDVGAYEFQNPLSLISYAWLQKYGLATDGSADYADADHDGMNNWQEWITNTNPTNSLSALQMLAPDRTNALPGIAIHWTSAGITYFLQRTTNLIDPFITIATNVFAAPGVATYRDAAATNAVPYFYRVGAQP